MKKDSCVILSDSPILLGVNIDHIATLRNARGTTYPDPLRFAKIAVDAGADIVTLHLREDRRHIKDDDLKLIQAFFRSSETRINLECSVNADMVNIACATLPTDVCLVPERREELTTEGGLDVVKYKKEVFLACKRLTQKGINVSLFIDASIEQVNAVLDLEAKNIEIHTGRYADAVDAASRKDELTRIEKVSRYAKERGLNVNAGHGLHLGNVMPIASIKEVKELNIGHALVSYALLVGFDFAIRDMRTLMLAARQGESKSIEEEISSVFRRWNDFESSM